MSPLARRLVWVLALVGLAVSLTSLYVHYQMLVQPGYISFCDINQTVSCQQAYLSRYGSVRGVPVALFGAIWFGFVLMLAFLGATGPDSVRESIPAYLFATATIGLAVVLYMAYAAFFVLKAVCVLCLATYAAVIGLFIVSGLSSSMPPMTTLPRRLFSDLRALVARPALLSVVIVFLAGAVSAVAFFPSEASLRAKAAQQAAQPATADQRSEFERFWEAQPRVTVPVPSDGAAVVIVKFTDMQCPMCGQSFFDLRPILSKYQSQYPGAVKFITKDYPLQSECNPNVLRSIHTAVCDAAVAVRLARQHNKGEALEEYFYSHQAMLSPAAVREAVQTIAGVQDFDLQYPRVIESVKADVGLGHLLNVRATPTFFINGVKLEGATVQTLDLAIAYELKKAGKIK
ncbi:MAG TPA: vitamin K epoxide reductase family protein [Vicinamibacterales bacterium]